MRVISRIDCWAKIGANPVPAVRMAVTLPGQCDLQIQKMAAILMSKQVARFSPFLALHVQCNPAVQIGLANPTANSPVQTVAGRRRVLVVMMAVVMPFKELVLRIPTSVNISNQVEYFLP